VNYHIPAKGKLVGNKKGIAGKKLSWAV